ncbi:hypothetical protein [Pectobacterium versatile]|uniref:hypothetical protein n=1 Tax=Pectobacterium versatile TaxID=2488639 RepID=UPI00102E4D44|nr:hypothetical protein [Pectobacterium versatile]TAI98628.1 hypothetical protein EG332_07495 [Pectobacterium versatile]UEQ08146.1 hypothetical protein LLE50_14935 [Pectobacterium versatile]
MTTPIHDAVSDKSPARQRLDEIANMFSALEVDIEQERRTLANLVESHRQAEAELKENDGKWESTLMENNGVENTESERALFLTTTAKAKIARLSVLMKDQKRKVAEMNIRLGGMTVEYNNAFLNVAAPIVKREVDKVIEEIYKVMAPSIKRVIGLCRLYRINVRDTLAAFYFSSQYKNIHGEVINVDVLEKIKSEDDVESLIINAIKDVIHQDNINLTDDELPDDHPGAYPRSVFGAMKNKPSPAQLARAKHDAEYREKLFTGEIPFSNL